MEKTTSEKIRLGIFVIIGTILLVVAVYLIGNQQNLFGNTYTINAVFKNVNGLQKGNNVRYAGINIGTVSGIEMQNDTAIRVSMLIQEKMRKHIKTNAIATIGSDGLVGSMVINVVPGNGTAPLIQSGDEILAMSKIATVDMLNTLSVTNENAAQLTQDLLKVTASLNRGEGTLGRLLNDTLMANDLQQMLVNLKNASLGANATISQLNDIAEKFNSDESAMGVLFNDSISAVKIQNTIAHLETSSIEIRDMTKDLNMVVGDIKDGKGTLNYLATDTILVSQLQNTIQNVEQGVERFNENMEALKHNFLTRGYFRKQEKQQRKDKSAE
ncbi:MlaD family protein [Ulvibacterium marinum]|uniref:MCE family protein n=1 Tax=Ulvibacterium marinum TaxID=2419782 RepID=A0A3B0C6C4_9FLAO|nr:MlaD family protein [Ulvibacterium marinum]RKN80228.1 MCE family protein [Ulvibacterium marinum]